MICKTVEMTLERWAALNIWANRLLSSLPR